MNHIKYVNISMANLPFSVEKMGLGGNYIYTEDNDPMDTAWKTKMCLLYNIAKCMETPLKVVI